MPRKTIAVFIAIIFVLVAINGIYHLGALANVNIMNIFGSGFAFGWSSNSGDNWVIDNSIIILNGKAFVSPISTVVSGDGGTAQQDQALIYFNNIGFSFGWDSIGSEKYSTSSAMSVGPLVPLNNNGLTLFPSTTTSPITSASPTTSTITPTTSPATTSTLTPTITPQISELSTFVLVPFFLVVVATLLLATRQKRNGEIDS